MGHQPDIAVFGLRREVRNIAGIEVRNVLICQCTFSGVVQDIDEMPVSLAIYGFKLYTAVFHAFKRSTAEEIQRLVVLSQKFIFTAVGNRRELLQIPDHEKLHPAERFAVTPDTSEFYIDVIHKIRTHHRHLIDYQQLEVTYQFQFGLVYPEIRFRFNDSFYERSDSELEEGMNRHRPGIDSSYSGRSQHYTFLFRMAHDLTEERGFSRPRLASKKQTHICLFYNKPGNIQFKISTFHLSISDKLSGSKQS